MPSILLPMHQKCCHLQTSNGPKAVGYRGRCSARAIRPRRKHKPYLTRRGAGSDRRRAGRGVDRLVFDPIDARECQGLGHWLIAPRDIEPTGRRKGLDKSRAYYCYQTPERLTFED